MCRLQRRSRGKGAALISSTVTKAIIPVAGLGTRFLPFTKSVPKALLPILDTPVIEFIVKEAIEAGVHEITLVTSPGQSQVEEYFEPSPYLEQQLQSRNREDLLKKIYPFHKHATIVAVKQTEPLGLAHALLMAEEQVKNEPFVVLLGDDLFFGSPSPSKQLIEAFKATNKSIIALKEVPKEEVIHYGIVDIERNKNFIHKINNIIEKPKQNEAPTNLAIPGRYIFTPEIFDYIKELKTKKNGEYQLTDALLNMAKDSKLFAIEASATRFDVGQVPGYLQATINLAKERGLSYFSTGNS